MRGGGSIVLGLVLMIGVAGANRPLLAAPLPTCHLSATLLVVSRERETDPGTDILVRARPSSPSPCVFDPKPTDFRPGQNEPVYFAALATRFLALDAGTGPDRRLLIFDGAARRKLVDIAYVDDESPQSLPKGFRFRAIEAAVDPKTCPRVWRDAEANKGARKAHRTRMMLFAFADSALHTSSETGCVQTQTDL